MTLVEEKEISNRKLYGHRVFWGQVKLVETRESRPVLTTDACQLHRRMYVKHKYGESKGEQGRSEMASFGFCLFQYRESMLAMKMQYALYQDKGLTKKVIEIA